MNSSEHSEELNSSSKISPRFPQPSLEEEKLDDEGAKIETSPSKLHDFSFS